MPKINCWDSFLLLFEKCWCKCAHIKLSQTLEKGSERIDNELDLVKLIKKLRTMTQVLKQQGLYNPTLKLTSINSGKAVIELDSPNSESDSLSDISQDQNEPMSDFSGTQRRSLINSIAEA